jgi:hypothetical protein
MIDAIHIIRTKTRRILNTTTIIIIIKTSLQNAMMLSLNM